MALALCIYLTAPARADDLPTTGLYIHVGPGAVLFSPSAKVKNDGFTVPGGTVAIHNAVTGVVELGYQRESFGASLTVGIPPTTTIYGADTLAAFGALGRIHYGISVLAAQYNFKSVGRFRPYVGAGPVLLLIFNNQDVAVQNLRTRDNFGVAVQAGADFDLDRHWSLFLDVKKAYLRTSARASLGQTSIAAKIRLDPASISGGISYRF